MSRVDLEFCRLQWATNAETLSRIKGDEQHWLLFAYGTFGAMLAGFLGSFGSQLASLSDGYRWLIFGLLCGAIQVYSFFWVGQALTLRQQYYRTLIRLLEAQSQLGEKIPKSWRLPSNSFSDPAAFRRWRQEATAPQESKFFEMLVLSFLIVFSVLVVTLALDAKRDYPVLLYLAAVIISGASLYAWPFAVYPFWDEYKLRQVFTNDLQRLQTATATAPVEPASHGQSG